MKNLLLTIVLLGLSVSGYAKVNVAKDPSKTGVTETICKNNLDHLNRVSSANNQVDKDSVETNTTVKSKK